MSILSRLLYPKTVSDDLRQDHREILDIWKKYRRTVDEKGPLIATLTRQNCSARIPRIRILIDIELAELSDELKDESKLIAELELIGNQQFLNRLVRMEQAIAYFETRHKYIYELLRMLHQILAAQKNIIIQPLLLQGVTFQTPAEQLVIIDRLINNLKAQITRELVILAKIDERETFSDIFLALITGEEIIKQMTEKEQKMEIKMQAMMRKSFATSKPTGELVDKWVRAVFKAVQEQVSEWVAEQKNDACPEHADFEFVNRPEFETLVRSTAKQLRTRTISESMIAVFIHIYRDWFTYEIPTRRKSTQ